MENADLILGIILILTGVVTPIWVMVTDRKKYEVLDFEKKQEEEK